MILTISLFLALTLATAAFVLAPRLAVRRVAFDTTPDRPHPFGYKMAWLAIRTRDMARVAEVLQLEVVETANWRSGIGTAYDDRLGQSHVFLSPPVDGWTFVVGLSLPHPMNRNFVDKCTPTLLDLGAAFPDVQYYFSYPLIDFYAWVRVCNGKLLRAFAIGDEGIIWNKGRLSKDERSLGLKLFEVRGVRGRKGDAGGQISSIRQRAMCSLWPGAGVSIRQGLARARAKLPSAMSAPGRRAGEPSACARARDPTPPERIVQNFRRLVKPGPFAGRDPTATEMFGLPRSAQPTRNHWNGGRLNRAWHRQFPPFVWRSGGRAGHRMGP
jgi:hypothetical protein